MRTASARTEPVEVTAVIDVLYGNADGEQTAFLDDLLTRAGYRRRCVCKAIAERGRPCPVCAAADPDDLFDGTRAQLTVTLPRLRRQQTSLYLDLSLRQPSSTAACCEYAYRLRHAGRWLQTGHWRCWAQQPRTLLQTALLLAAGLATDRRLDPETSDRLRAWTTALPGPTCAADDDVTVIDGPSPDKRALITIDSYGGHCPPNGDVLAPALLINRFDVSLAKDIHQPQHSAEIVAAWRHCATLGGSGDTSPCFTAPQPSRSSPSTRPPWWCSTPPTSAPAPARRRRTT
ncbi:hypothetical protein AB0B66_10580 [Catellatospora sp. NPDC049111]|uniref:hypothetical protein n=1 Tax=Catellatospora sp. NPDC049111 TaxID=3155271 RepID=UPI0034053F66